MPWNNMQWALLYYGKIIIAYCRCWINISRSDLRYSLFYIPLWITFAISAIFTTLFVVIVYRVELGSNPSEMALTRSASLGYLYAIFFLISWIPATTNRAYEAFYGSSPFILPFLHCIFIPLQGFWNAVAYYLVNQKKNKKKTRVRKPIQRQDAVPSSAADSNSPHIGKSSQISS